MNIELANLLKAKKAAVMASKDTSVIDANIEKVRKAKYAAASTPKQISAVENNEEMEENKHGIYVIDSLGYDEDDNEHFEVNVNGKTIIVIEEPDQILHSSDNSELLDKHYDDIKDVIGSYHQAKSKTTTPGENAAASSRNKITGADFKALAQDDEQERRWEDRQLSNAAKICVNEFETGEPFHEIIDGVAEEHGLDSIQLAKYLNYKGFIEEDELNKFIEYVNNTPGEDAESKPKPHKSKSRAWSPSSDSPESQAAYAKENERRRKAGLSHESVQITNFIKALSQKNYASAHKYLQGVVEAKLKKSISNALNK